MFNLQFLNTDIFLLQVLNKYPPPCMCMLPQTPFVHIIRKKKFIPPSPVWRVNYFALPFFYSLPFQPPPLIMTDHLNMSLFFTWLSSYHLTFHLQKFKCRLFWTQRLWSPCFISWNVYFFQNNEVDISQLASSEQVPTSPTGPLGLDVRQFQPSPQPVTPGMTLLFHFLFLFLFFHCSFFLLKGWLRCSSCLGE